MLRFRDRSFCCLHPRMLTFWDKLWHAFRRVSEVFVLDEAAKTFNFVAFFVEAGSWGLV